MIHRILIDAVSRADSKAGPWVDGIRFEIAVSADIPRVSPLGVVNRSFENAVVVVIPILLVQNAIIVVVEGIGSIATVEALDQIADAVIVIIEVIEITDTIIVVILGVGLLEEEAITRVGQKHGWVGYLA